MAPIMRKEEQGTFRDQPWRPIMSNGLHSFIQSLLQNGQPMIAYALVRSFGGVNRDVGFLNVGLFLVTGLSVPITMVAPLLFARWTSTKDDSLMDRLYALTFPSVAIGAGLGLVLAGGAHFGVPVLFGKEYVAAVTSTEVMLLTLPLVCHIRVLAPALHARGRPAVNTVAGVVRVASFVASAMLLAHVTGKPLVATGAGWAIAEILAAIWTLVSLKFLLTQKTSSVSLEYR
jgi:O-antigen/teichoic acid export membrane protein